MSTISHRELICHLRMKKKTKTHSGHVKATTAPEHCRTSLPVWNGMPYKKKKEEE